MPRQPYKWKREELNLPGPSQKDGFSRKQEACWRRRYCLLIQRTVQKIGVNHKPVETAIKYCHRYFAVKSMARNDPWVIACAALYLACKVEEQPRSVNTVSEAMFSIAHRHKPNVLKMQSDREFANKLKEKVLTAERALLYVLGFDFDVEHPTLIALRFMEDYHRRLLPAHVTDNNEVQEWGNQITNIAWNVCLYSYQSLLCLQHEAAHIALASIFVALQLLRLDPGLRNGWHWWEEIVGASLPAEVLIDIASQLLDLYERHEDKAPVGPHVAPFRLQQPGRPAQAHAAAQLQRFAPGSDPRSDQSEQTPLSPATKANAASPMGPLAAAAPPAAAL